MSLNFSSGFPFLRYDLTQADELFLMHRMHPQFVQPAHPQPHVDTDQKVKKVAIEKKESDEEMAHRLAAQDDNEQVDILAAISRRKRKDPPKQDNEFHKDGHFQLPDLKRIRQDENNAPQVAPQPIAQQIEHVEPPPKYDEIIDPKAVPNAVAAVEPPPPYVEIADPKAAEAIAPQSKIEEPYNKPAFRHNWKI